MAASRLRTKGGDIRGNRGEWSEFPSCQVVKSRGGRGCLLRQLGMSAEAIRDECRGADTSGEQLGMSAEGIPQIALFIRTLDHMVHVEHTVTSAPLLPWGCKTCFKAALIINLQIQI
eukprot:scaffold57025_cov19-Tisochrysis_lutea.AAC.1